MILTFFFVFRGFQRTMVKTMSMAAKVPHFHYVEEINCDALAELKASFQTNNTEPGIKFTFLPILIKSLSMALNKYPMVNSCFNEESLEVILRGTYTCAVVYLAPFMLLITKTACYMQLLQSLEHPTQYSLEILES